MASPQTPSARKMPTANTPTPAKGRSSKGTPATEKKRKTPKAGAAQGSTAKVTKRKAKTETVSPKNATPKGKSASTKKQKVEHEEQTENANEVSEAFPSFEPNFHLPTPFDSPIPSPQLYANMSQQPAFNRPEQRSQMPQPIAQHNTAPNNNNLNAGMNLIDQLIVHIYRNNPALLPQCNEAITSSHIDNFTYTIWQICLKQNNGTLLTGAARTSATFHDVKIRALGIMNLLPSWWFMRERIVGILKNTGRPLDDSEMEIGYSVACTLAARVVHIVGIDGRMMGHGGGAMGQDGRMGQASGAAHLKREDGFAQMSPDNGAVGMDHLDGFTQRSPGQVPVRRSHVEGYTQMSPHNGSVRMDHDEGFAQMSPGNAPARKDHGDGFAQMSSGNGPVRNDHGNGHARSNHSNGLTGMNSDHLSFDMGEDHGFAQMSTRDGQTTGAQAGNDNEFYEDEKLSGNF